MKGRYLADFYLIEVTFLQSVKFISGDLWPFWLMEVPME